MSAWKSSGLRTRRLGWLALILLSFLLVHGTLLASADEEIALIDQQLLEQGESASLHFRRGRLLMIVEDWDAALKALDRAESLDSGIHRVDFLRGEIELARMAPEAAGRHLERFLRRSGTSATAEIRSRAFFLLGQAREAYREHHKAADAYRQSLDVLQRPTPELYLALARSLVKADSTQSSEAIRILDEGCQKLGSLPVLEQHALDLEVASRDWKAALERLERLISQSQRPESWLVQQAQIFIDREQPKQAVKSLLSAQEALERLPKHRRHTPAMTSLAEDIENKLEKLGHGKKAFQKR